MVALLLDLGADPLAVDGSGFSAAAYAMSPGVDRRIMEGDCRHDLGGTDQCRARTRRPRGGPVDLIAALALGDWETAARLLRDIPGLLEPDAARAGVLHLMAKRDDGAAVKWLLDHGADPNARWSHWDAEVTPLHLAVRAGHVESYACSSQPAPTRASGTASTTAMRSAGRNTSDATTSSRCWRLRPGTTDASGGVLHSNVRRVNARAFKRHSRQPVQVNLAQPWQARQEHESRIGHARPPSPARLASPSSVNGPSINRCAALVSPPCQAFSLGKLCSLCKPASVTSLPLLK